MQPAINWKRIDACFEEAAREGRDILLEYETYELLRNSGAESVPLVNLLARGARPSNEELLAFPGDKVVMKIVSPTILHKTDVGGVKIIDKHPGKIRSTWRRMLDEVPERFAAWLEHHPGGAPAAYAGLAGDPLREAVARDVRGVLMCQFMPPDSSAFGNELLMSLRRTREFGMVITAGLGGTDTELYAQRFRKGQAVASASVELTDADTFFDLFRRTIAYEKLAGRTRGQGRIVSDDQLLECIASFIAMGRHYSPENPAAPFVIEELEINPFAFTDYQMVPLDGLCRFSRPAARRAPRPVERIAGLVHPRRIGIIGVSDKRANFGRTILDNILAAGFPASDVVVVHPSCDEVAGVRCTPDLKGMGRVDLFVVAVGAEQVPAIVDGLVEDDLAEAVLLIPGGLGEKAGSEERAAAVRARIDEAHAQGGGPVFLGGNSLGVLSRPGRFDTIFIPDAKLPKPQGQGGRSAFISQSGAFLVTRVSRLVDHIDPAYLVSIGNQTDLTAGDLLTWFKDVPDLGVLAVYMEGFADDDGLSFCRAVRDAVACGRDVVFYKAGRTPEGKSATAGHTASVAGDYMVCTSCVRQAGALVAESFAEFEDLYRLAVHFHGVTVRGDRIAAVSGAGFEAVGMADSISGDDFRVRLATLSPETARQLRDELAAHRLDRLVDVRNPLDINPAADDALHARTVSLLAADPGVDAVVVGVVPLSPAMQTLPAGMRDGDSLDAPGSIATLLPETVRGLAKPVIAVVDGGALYDPLVERLEAGGVLVFRSCDRAVAALAKYLEGRLYAATLRPFCTE